MSTFKEICEDVLEEVNGRPVELSSVNLGKDSAGDYYVTNPTYRNIIRWVNDLNLQIQQQMIQAHFMHKDGVFLTTVADTPTYRKRYVRYVDEHSLYAVKSGSAGRLPIIMKSYETWTSEERAQTKADATPLWLIRQPDEKWRLDPIPNAIFNIYGSWWIEPCKFESASDEPLWDSTYHDVLKWKALGLWASEYQGEGAGAIIKDRISQMLPPLERAFKQRYIRSIVGASPLT